MIDCIQPLQGETLKWLTPFLKAATQKLSLKRASDNFRSLSFLQRFLRKVSQATNPVNLESRKPKAEKAEKSRKKPKDESRKPTIVGHPREQESAALTIPTIRQVYLKGMNFDQSLSRLDNRNAKQSKPGSTSQGL